MRVSGNPNHAIAAATAAVASAPAPVNKLRRPAAGAGGADAAIATLLEDDLLMSLRGHPRAW